MPSVLVVAAGLGAMRLLTDRLWGPGIAGSARNAGRLAAELIGRYEREAGEALDRLASGAPPEAIAVDFVAIGPGESVPAVVHASDPGRPGLPGPDDWRRLAQGSAPPLQDGRVLRFFRSGFDDGRGRAVGWILPDSTAAMLAGAREDLGRVRNLEIWNRTGRIGLTVAAVALLVLTIAVAFGVARRTARRIARPVGALAEAADAIAAGDLSRRAPVAGEGEVRELVLAFNRMGAQLESSREDLLRAERLAAWRDVARRVAHEIKNPLTPIRLAVHRLQSKLPEGDDAARECLRSIDEEVESLGRLASSFSDFAKLPQPSPAPTDLAAIARGVVELFRDATPGVRTTYEGPGALPLVADRDQLRRAVTNLVKNAQEAVRGGGDAGSVRVVLARDDDRAVLEVVDDGPGIPDEIRGTLFRPGVSAKPGGSGLGLAMVHRIAADHRGTLEYRDGGPGARFVLRIPLEPESSP